MKIYIYIYAYAYLFWDNFEYRIQSIVTTSEHGKKCNIMREQSEHSDHHFIHTNGIKWSSAWSFQTLPNTSHIFTCSMTTPTSPLSHSASIQRLLKIAPAWRCLATRCGRPSRCSGFAWRQVVCWEIWGNWGYIMTYNQLSCYILYS